MGLLEPNFDQPFLTASRFCHTLRLPAVSGRWRAKVSFLPQSGNWVEEDEVEGDEEDEDLDEIIFGDGYPLTFSEWKKLEALFRELGWHEQIEEYVTLNTNERM